MTRSNPRRAAAPAANARSRAATATPVTTRRSGAAASAVAKAWRAYLYEPHRTVDEIARTELGIGSSAFRRQRRTWSWPERRTAIAALCGEAASRPSAGSLPPALPAAGESDPRIGRATTHIATLRGEESPRPASAGDADPQVDFATVARGLKRLLLRQLDGLDPEPGDLERTARTLVTIPKTIDAIRALETLQGSASHVASRAEPDAALDEPPARSLEELRQELARHLDRLAEEEELERGFGFDVEDGAGGPA